MSKPGAQGNARAVAPGLSQAKGILFLCVANSARSQMAEGWARSMLPSRIPVYSAGSNPGRLNPYSVRAMQEVGIDISLHFSKSLAEIPLERIGTVVTLCSDEVCPFFPGDAVVHHVPFDDPAAVEGSDAERLDAFRRVRDQIRDWLQGFLQAQKLHE